MFLSRFTQLERSGRILTGSCPQLLDQPIRFSATEAVCPFSTTVPLRPNRLATRLESARPTTCPLVILRSATSQESRSSFCRTQPMIDLSLGQDGRRNNL